MNPVLLEVVGWAGSAVLVLSLVQTQLRRLRVLNLVGCLVLVGYNAVLGVWPMVALNVVLSAVNAWHLLRARREVHDATAYEVLSVAGDDDYLRHVVRTHEADIRRFNPGFVHDPFAGDRAYLVLRGDETIGVVLVRDEGQGRAQVLLDYVTPRFRDRSPGEVVFGPEGPLRESGFSEVRTPHGMIAPYYDRLGLEPEGDHYLLRLPGVG